MVGDRGLWDLLVDRASATPELLCLVDERGARLTFAELRVQAERMAAGYASLGVEPGAVVAWQLPTWIDTLVLVMALARLGAVQVPLLPIYRAREVDHALGSTGACYYIAPRSWRETDYAALATSMAERHPALTPLLVSGRGSFPMGAPQSLPAAPTDAQGVRWIFHTSGTTGTPKGVLHTDATLIASGRGYVDAIAIDEHDRLPVVFSVAHIGAMVVHSCSLLAGAGQILVERFEPATVTDVLVREGVTLPGVSQVFLLEYLDQQRRRPDQPLFPHARAYTNGGAPKNLDLHLRLKEVMGVGLYSNYGLTECPMALLMPIGAPDDKLATTDGRPATGLDFRVMTTDDRVAAPGEVGELRLRGPLVSPGYVDPGLTASAVDADGYLRTGDLVREDDDGYLQIVGRLKDIIIRKGENISAKEIEDLLFAHPAVREVAVVGVPDERSGERCCAVVVARDGVDPLPIDELTSYLRDAGLMLQKIPEQWVTVPELPRNNAGKVLKAELRQRMAAEPFARAGRKDS